MSHLSEYIPSSEQFLSGAQRMSSVLGQLSKEGIKLPEVKETTIHTFHEELRTAGDILRPELLQAESFEQLVEIYTSMIPSMEFNFPDPEMYQDENPAIMDWIKSLCIDAQRGALLIYELKRRQFLNDLTERNLYKSEGFGKVIRKILHKTS